MKKILLGAVLLLAFACKPKPTSTDVENRLKRAMSEFLYAKVNNDSSQVKFNVKDVTYFADAEFYECEFHVQMTRGGRDTTDMMRARIAKDFSKVVRKE
jgi:hypothetical protein